MFSETSSEIFSESQPRRARLRNAGVTGIALLGLLTAGAASADTAFWIGLGDHHRYARHQVHRHHDRCGHAYRAHHRPRHAVRHALARLAPHVLFDSHFRFERKHRSHRRHGHAGHRRHERRLGEHSEERRDRNETRERGRRHEG